MSTPSMTTSVQLPVTNGALLVHRSWTSDVLQHLYTMCKEGKFCDIALMSAEEENLPCHIAVMVAASGYFKRLLLSLNQSFVNAHATIHLAVESKFLHHILSFIYTGQVLVAVEDIEGLKQTAAFLEIPALQKLCENYASTPADKALADPGTGTTTSDEVAAETIEEGAGQTGETVETQEPSNSSRPDQADFEPVLGEVLEHIELEIENQVPTTQVSGQLGESRVPTGQVAMDLDNETIKTLSIREVTLQDVTIQDPELPFGCTYEGCNRLFRRRDTLQTHERVHSGARPFRCEQCDKSYKQKAHLTEHIRVHTGEKPYKCKHCDRRFASFSFFSRHRSTHVGELRSGATGFKDGRPGFACRFCEKVFIARSQYRAHENRHLGILPYKCCKCEEIFESREKAYKHESIVHSLHKTTKCPVCEKLFVNKGHYTEHLRTHTGDKPFHCGEPGCGKKYARKKDLTIHLTKVHTEQGALRFQCLLCEKSFSHARHLNDHQNSHSGQAPYKCKTCGKSFASYSTHYKHIKAKHSALISLLDFECMICAAKFTRKDSLKLHIKNFHPGGHAQRYGCSQCEKRFRLKSLLRKHIGRMHPVPIVEEGRVEQTVPDDVIHVKIEQVSENVSENSVELGDQLV